MVTLAVDITVYFLLGSLWIRSDLSIAGHAGHWGRYAGATGSVVKATLPVAKY
ncbi:MAG: hypothetical protein ACI9WS_003137 [Paraglaciecola psychrophila]|jgi:hypothetical protein